MICKVKVISTGSKGNAVLLNDEILIDCGVPFRELEPYCKGLKLVLLTHIHGDHFNPETIKRLHFLRPALRWCVSPWLVEPMARIGVDRRVTDEAMQRHDLFYLLSESTSAYVWYDPIPHDVPNCAWHIQFADGEKSDGFDNIFYATDCASLNGVSALAYDLYLIEANYGEEEIRERMKRKLEAGEFSYESRAMESHLSREQARAWLAQNAAIGKSHVLYLHQHQDEEAANDTVGTSLQQSADAP